MKYSKASDKWMAIAEGGEVDSGVNNCPFCEQFWYEDEEDEEECCKGCPVMDDTGQDNCYDSPYWAYHQHHKDDHPENYNRDSDDGAFHLPILCPECQRLALNEWLYLISIGE